LRFDDRLSLVPCPMLCIVQYSLVLALIVSSSLCVRSRDLGVVRSTITGLRRLSRLDRHERCHPGDARSHRQVSCKKWCDIRDTSVGYTGRRTTSPEARAVHDPTFFDPNNLFDAHTRPHVRRRIDLAYQQRQSLASDHPTLFHVAGMPSANRGSAPWKTG
jgi:hypothetical protein